MANLLDTIKQNTSQLQGQQAPITDETQQVQNLLRAKSGKVVGPSDTATSNIAEQAAVQDTQQQIGQIAPQIQMQQEQNDISQRRSELDKQQQLQQVDQSKKFQTVENKMKTNELLNGLQRDKATLDMDKDRSRLEQTSFLLSMQDQKYVNDLQDVGRRQRLQNTVNFQGEMQKVAFGDSLDLLKQKLGTQDILQVNDRDYKTAIADMSIDDAIAISGLQMGYNEQQAKQAADLARYNATQQAQQANLQGKYTGLQQLLQGGIQAFGASQNQRPTSGGQT